MKDDKSVVARKGANLLGPGEAMADRSRRRMKAASVSIGQQEEGKRLSEMDRREGREGPSDGGAQTRGRLRMKEEKEAPGGQGARKMA